MAITYNTGATASASAVPHTTQPAITIPAGVLTGDVMIAAVNMFTFTPASPGITLTPTVGSWTQIGGGLQASGASGGTETFGAVWARTATGADAGTALTFAFTGTPGGTDQFWWSIGLVAYTGAGGVDVSAGAGGLNHNTCPSLPTVASGDWAVTAGALSIGGGGVITADPAGTATHRVGTVTSGIALDISDSNGAVGGPGTSIGGGVFSDTSGGTGDWWADFTIGIKPPAAPSSSGLLLATFP